jgi:hypothetical protein
LLLDWTIFRYDVAAEGEPFGYGLFSGARIHCCAAESESIIKPASRRRIARNA